MTEWISWRLPTFMRSTKAPSRGPITARAAAGEALFTQVGCATCHTASIVTATAGTRINGGALTIPPAFGNKVIHPYSDFLLHDIGTGDGIPVLPTPEHAGTATQIRTAPLWALRTRNRLMHDGLSFTKQEAILRHAGQAAAVRLAFEALTAAAAGRVTALPRLALRSVTGRHGLVSLATGSVSITFDCRHRLDIPFTGVRDATWVCPGRRIEPERSGKNYRLDIMGSRRSRPLSQRLTKLRLVCFLLCWLPRIQIDP